MPKHDIIDNRKEKLVDHINRILSSTESARFAVGYFFLSGLESIAQRLAGVKELRLLIGNTTNRETLEQLAEGYRRLDLVAEGAEAEAYPKRTETRRMADETAGNIRSAIELMDQPSRWNKACLAAAARLWWPHENGHGPRSGRPACPTHFRCERLVFYRLTETELIAERLMHGARDLPRRQVEPPGASGV